jgi:cation diffusion facilitator CzcD-associated flavoprotein CzcO
MYRWRSQMPKGMFLKSEGCTSSLSDPDGRRTLEQLWRKQAALWQLGYTSLPGTLYRICVVISAPLAPEVEEVMVNAVESSGDGFELQIANGATAKADKVIVATGLEYTAQIPAFLSNLPPEFLSHTVQSRPS